MKDSAVQFLLLFGSTLTGLANRFLGERLLGKDVETQRILRSTFVASLVATFFGLIFVGL